ncbi:MAG: TetR/AcrR family transcriptional regulator [Catenulispora sp.]|nr:TetR/AcrR family transcriptional regulator [Catenulispora sp.]
MAAETWASRLEGDVGALRTPRDRWVEEGLAVLAEGGPDAVRVEVLAKRLGVTKGGFYGYFADREALLAVMLDAWERESVQEVLEQVEQEGGDARTRFARAGRLTFSSDRLLPIDLAIRDWARRDEAVAARLRRVDGRRLAYLREVFSALHDDPVDVEARCLLAFCLAVGHHFLAADLAGGAPADVLARAGDLVFGEPATGA